jgi:hypothetical protein
MHFLVNYIENIILRKAEFSASWVSSRKKLDAPSHFRKEMADLYTLRQGPSRIPLKGTIKTEYGSEFIAVVKWRLV